MGMHFVVKRKVKIMSDQLQQEEKVAKRKNVYHALCKLFKESPKENITDDLTGLWKFIGQEDEIHRLLRDLTFHICFRKKEIKDRNHKDFEPALRLLKKSCANGEKGLKKLENFNLREEFDWEYFSNVARPNDFQVENKERYRLTSEFETNIKNLTATIDLIEKQHAELKDKLKITTTRAQSRERDIAIVIVAVFYSEKKVLPVTDEKGRPSRALRSALETIFLELGLSIEPKHACNYAIENFVPEKFPSWDRKFLLTWGKDKLSSKG